MAGIYNALGQNPDPASRDRLFAAARAAQVAVPNETRGWNTSPQSSQAFSSTPNVPAYSAAAPTAFGGMGAPRGGMFGDPIVQAPAPSGGGIAGAPLVASGPNSSSAY